MGLNNMEEISSRYQIEKKRFFERNILFKRFKDIDEQRKDEIRNLANIWLEEHIYDNNIRLLLCLFSNLNNPRVNKRISKKITKESIYDFNSNDEELMFYMFVSDPEFKLLKISYEESKIENIKKRYHDEFRLDLDSRLLTIETIFNKKYPTIEDEYVLTKKI